MNYKSIVLLGHPNYYTKFGYKKAVDFGIELPYDAPSENCMAIDLSKNGLQNINGIVEYPREFFI